MILDEYVSIGLGSRNFRYYENLGYIIPRKIDAKGRYNFTKGEKITVKVSDLLPSSNVKIRCQCDMCGEIREVQYSTLVGRKNSQYLIDGKTLCVSCRNHTYSGEKNSQYKHGCTRYCEYRNNAKRRGIEFQLTSDEFKELVEQPCHYCGGHSSEYDTRSRGNGIDRKDSSIGYIVDNCVPCCSKCNFIKNDMPYNDFKNYIKKVYQRLFGNENQE